jgi:hypothetical protein
MPMKAVSRCSMCIMSLALIALLTRSLAAQVLPLDQLRSPTDSVRTRAFYAILSLANPHISTASLRPRAEGLARFARTRPDLISSLSALLELENTRVQTAPQGSLGEDWSDYYGDLIGCVATLRDARAMRGLLGAIGTGNMATDGLAALGDVAVPGVIRASRAQEAVTRFSAITTMHKMVHGTSGTALSSSSTAAVREALLPALEDEFPNNRLMALDAIVAFHDDSVRAAIERLSRNDQFVETRGGHSIYPIREKAAGYLTTAQKP